MKGENQERRERDVENDKREKVKRVSLLILIFYGGRGLFSLFLFYLSSHVGVTLSPTTKIFVLENLTYQVKD